ncbi:MAG: glycosyltransferase [Candidatus Peregrinibacteria bacterium Greene0416_19]|nr:MAG: glycosyltransferase [Candidatus Peregrinibacteria bacterium Greene0416_19]
MRARIVILSAFATPYRSGAEACAEEIAKRLLPRYDVTIVTARMRRDLPRSTKIAGGVPLLRVGIGSERLDPWLFPLLAPFHVRRLRPVLIHAILETFAGLALHWCGFFSKKSKRLLTLQTTNRSFLKSTILRSPDAVTAISSALVRSGRERGRTDIELISNGVDLPALRQACERYPKMSGRILFVGRLEPMKGIDILLRSCAEIFSEPGARGVKPTWGPRPLYGAPGCMDVRIVGDGSQRRSLEKLAHGLGVAGHVQFLGYLPPAAVCREFAQAEIFCGLSISEAMGNVFLEAQAAGCAVIGTRVGGIPDIVKDGETGLLIPPNDVNTAAWALKALLTDAHLRSRLQEAARRHAEEYDWDIVAGRYATVYDRLLPSVAHA